MVKVKVQVYSLDQVGTSPQTSLNDDVMIYRALKRNKTFILQLRSYDVLLRSISGQTKMYKPTRKKRNL